MPKHVRVTVPDIPGQKWSQLLTIMSRLPRGKAYMLGSRAGPPHSVKTMGLCPGTTPNPTQVRNSLQVRRCLGSPTIVLLLL